VISPVTLDRVNRFVDVLGKGDSCFFGTWVKLSTLETVEMLAIAGFDFIVVDMEHAPHTFETAYRCTVLAQSLGMYVLVRIPEQATTDLQRVLDTGADGVLVPRVRNAAEAHLVVDGMRFSPNGSRGMGSTSRAGRWGQRPVADYVAEGETGVLRIPQLEDPDALRDAATILDVDGVNAVFVGTGDLSLATGKPASHPDNAALIDHLLAVAGERSVPCGTAVGNAKAALEARDRGFKFVMVSNDTSMFAQAANEIVTGLRS
jgi:2-keto-3-deoxy-L-rhamnonate aldolase RhmA